MKIDAHYYAVLGFCRACGFSREAARTVAYASQFVDDAKINHMVIKGSIPEGVHYDVIDGSPCFFNMATCHSYTRIKTFNYDAMTNNTSAFHFVPGCSGKTFVKKMRCKEAGPVIASVLQEVLEENDPIKLGIALHAYADSFSHQGFSGLLSKVNDINQLEIREKSAIWKDRLRKKLRGVREAFCKLCDWVIPAYGHGQALTFPDLPYMVWSYVYDYSDEFSDTLKSSGIIDNRERYKRAFKATAKYLILYLRKHPACQEGEADLDSLQPLFEALLTRKRDKARIRKWRNVLVSQGLLDKRDQEGLTYDRDRWLREAFSNFDQKLFKQRKVSAVVLRPDFSESNWYRYYLAVKWYKERIFHHCAQHGLTICR
ncbi:MAG: hypothetical protein J7M32_01285 [Deltaproteobacteria bacterium]|nr:hypothetical protein [Deltaproteobacteria bacterium]